MCPGSKAMKRKTPRVGGCELDKGERDVTETEMWGTDECDMEVFGTLDSSEASLLNDVDGSHERPNKKGFRLAILFQIVYGNNVMSAQTLEYQE